VLCARVDAEGRKGWGDMDRHGWLHCTAFSGQRQAESKTEPRFSSRTSPAMRCDAPESLGPNCPIGAWEKDERTFRAAVASEFFSRFT
jgi:hypothetical protein